MPFGRADADYLCGRYAQYIISCHCGRLAPRFSLAYRNHKESHLELCVGGDYPLLFPCHLPVCQRAGIERHPRYRIVSMLSYFVGQYRLRPLCRPMDECGERADRDLCHLDAVLPVQPAKSLYRVSS